MSKNLLQFANIVTWPGMAIYDVETDTHMIIDTGTVEGYRIVPPEAVAGSAVFAISSAPRSSIRPET